MNHHGAALTSGLPFLLDTSSRDTAWHFVCSLPFRNHTWLFCTYGHCCFFFSFHDEPLSFTETSLCPNSFTKYFYFSLDRRLCACQYDQELQPHVNIVCLAKADRSCYSYIPESWKEAFTFIICWSIWACYGAICRQFNSNLIYYKDIDEIMEFFLFLKFHFFFCFSSHRYRCRHGYEHYKFFFNVINVEFDFFNTENNIFLRHKRSLSLENFDYRPHLS